MDFLRLPVNTEQIQMILSIRSSVLSNMILWIENIGDASTAHQCMAIKGRAIHNATIAEREPNKQQKTHRVNTGKKKKKTLCIFFNPAALQDRNY